MDGDTAGAAFEEVDAAAVAGWDRTAATPVLAWERDTELAERASGEWGPFGPCSAHTPLLEESLIEFNTTGCDSYSARAPVPLAIPDGAVVELVLSHSTLFAPDAASGRMLIQWAGRDLLTWTRSIPGPSDIVTTYWRTNHAWEPGTMLGVHVSNHGANAWYLVALNVMTPPR